MKKSRSPTSEENLVHILHRPGLENALKLFALDYLFDNLLFTLNGTFYPGDISAAKLFQWYSTLTREVALHEAPWKSPQICSLFRITQDGAGIRITPDTFLDEGSKSSRSTDVTGRFLSRKEFGNKLRRLLSERLCTRVMADRISPRSCVQFASHENCPERLVVSHRLCNNKFNQQVRFHLLRIMILDNLYSISQVDKFPSRIGTKR